MYRLLNLAFWTIVRWLLGLRYRVRVTGLDALRDVKGPTLVMPNHPGYIDPPLVLANVRLGRPVRPMVYAGTFRNPVLYPMMRFVDALEVPDLADHSQSSQERTRETIDAIVAGLVRGESFLVYPSGRIQRQGREVVGAARAASEILSRVPEANVVLVRTEGVWGSMFTFAQTGKLPELGRCMLRAVGWMAANLLFFAPRRDVRMTIEVVKREDLPGTERDRLNRFLEEWYNRGGPREPVYVPCHRLFGPRDFAYPALTGSGLVDCSKVRPETRKAVNEMVEERLGRTLAEEEALADATLDVIGLDSLERMDVALAIEDRFGFRSDRVASTLGELWALAEGLGAGAAEEEVPAPALWRQRRRPNEPAEVLAETVAEAFVRRALTSPDDVALADRLSGVLTYRRLLIGASLLSKRLAKLEGEAVGVLFPASVAADITFYSLHMAGKLPVMMNWTTGPANLAHAVRSLGVRYVVTSRRFVDRLRIEVEGAEFVYLEDLRAGIGKWEMALAMAATHLAPRSYLRALPKQSPDDAAAILFTSGSESAPKAVPLSHANLIHNVRASIATVELTRHDALLGFLPPFHSFGLTGNVLAPVLAGIPLVHHPDPTDARGLVSALAAYRPTVTLATPTFLSYMMAAAHGDEFESLRLVLTGAEKCPESVFARFAELAHGAVLVEGYGITECSPVIAANRPRQQRAGTIGLPIPGVEVCVVDPDSNALLGPNQTGMLLVRGPSVFAGYRNFTGPSPFVEVGGKQWYRTGDLVQIDDDGWIHFCGRLKRFLKAAGEMISLPALEEPFAVRYPPTEDGPQVAVEGVETPEGRHIVLFTTAEITLRDANRMLSDAGFRGVMRLDEVRRVDSIPVLGTGKTDYKVLRSLVLEKAEAYV